MTSTQPSRKDRAIHPARSLIIVIVVAVLAFSVIVIDAGGQDGLWEPLAFLAAIYWAGWLWGMVPVIVAIVLARRDLRDLPEEDARGRSVARAGLIAGSVVLVLLAAMMLGLLGFLAEWMIHGDNGVY